MYIAHPEFKIEKTKDLPLWRYMDFWKFLKLLSSSQLFFPNVEMLGDQHEGKIPNKIYELMLAKEREQSPAIKFVEGYKDLVEDKLRSKTFICSWVASNKESYGMWKMYSNDKLGVAIKTDFESLKKSFSAASEDIYIGEVFYYDPTKPKYKIGNTFFSFLVKHNYYDFESEVRCLTENQPDEKRVTSKYIQIDLNTLIKEVYISPLASETIMLDILEFLKSKYSLEFNIRVSGVNDRWI